MTIGLSSRVRLVRLGTYLIFCPGCTCAHELEINSRQAFDRKLGFDGDMENPTFDPAIRHWTERGLCEYELRGGKMRFSTDAFHDLAGKTVELPHFPLP